jgi:hypothetical protein
MFSNRSRGSVPPPNAALKPAATGSTKHGADNRRQTDQGGAPIDEEAALLAELAAEDKRLEEVKLRSSMASLSRMSHMGENPGSRPSSLPVSRRHTADMEHSISREMSADSISRSEGAGSEAGGSQDIDHGLQEPVRPVTPSSAHERSIGEHVAQT